MRNILVALFVGALMGLLVFVFYNDDRILTSVLVMGATALSVMGVMALTGKAEKALRKINNGG